MSFIPIFYYYVGYFSTINIFFPLFFVAFYVGMNFRASEENLCDDYKMNSQKNQIFQASSLSSLRDSEGFHCVRILAQSFRHLSRLKFLFYFLNSVALLKPRWWVLFIRWKNFLYLTSAIFKSIAISPWWRISH